MDTPTPYLARWWHFLEDGRIQCDLCPRDCRLQEGQRGACFVRLRENNQMILDTYGRSSGFCVDPIEKKPLAHFYPGSAVLSFGTAGCNLACRFCQNWDISKSRDVDKLNQTASPQAIALAARDAGALSVAFTYNDPVIFAEYAIDVASACHEIGIKTVAVTAGYIHPTPRVDFFNQMDAANVDLKGFTEKFYSGLCAAHLAPVLDTLLWIKHETNCWLEITTLLIPGENDSPEEIQALARWIYTELGTEVPLHFTAFHPDFRMRDKPRTPPETVQTARKIALAEGLRYVYTGNIHDPQGASTWCPQCGYGLIERGWHKVGEYRLSKSQRCPQCETWIAGRFGEFHGTYGKRQAIRIAPAPPALTQ